MFSSAFSSAFCVRRYIGPIMAQAAIVRGVACWARGSALVVGGKWLIGPAGKVYAFASGDSMATWIDNARGAGEREALIIASLGEAQAEAWKAKKRAKLAVIAGRVVNAAAAQKDREKRAALLAESDYCLSKWA